MFPQNFLFNKQWQIAINVSLLACNLIFIVFFDIFYNLSTDIVLKPQDVKRSMTIALLCLSGCIVVNMSFSSVTHSVYEDAKLTNDRIANNTKEKELFFATISHEIRNPLQSLLGSVELLQERSVSAQTSSALLEICKNCSETVLNLVTNILDMSKIAADKMQLSPASTDLREIISKIIRISQARAQSKNISLRMIDDRSMPATLQLDGQRVAQIVLNLVSNAIKFTSHGKVVIRLSWLPLPNSNVQVPELLSKIISSSSWKQTMVLEEKEGDVLSLKLDKYKTGYKPSYEMSRTMFTENSLLTKGGGKPEKCGIVKMEIMDTGIGVSKENIKKLFQPYQQAHAAISKYLLPE